LVTGSPSGPTLTLLKDDNTPSTSTTQTVKARFINGVNGSTATLSATIDNRSIGSATFKNQSTSYVTFPATAGTSTVVPSTVTNPTSLTSQTFPANGVYTVFIWGDGTNTPVLSLSPDR
jgi:hypothetical protein